jgi:hypothetical protein
VEQLIKPRRATLSKQRTAAECSSELSRNNLEVVRGYDRLGTSRPSRSEPWQRGPLRDRIADGGNPGCQGPRWAFMLGNIFGAPIEEVRFARDSPLEGDGFELLVPRHESPRFPKHPGTIAAPTV